MTSQQRRTRSKSSAASVKRRRVCLLILGMHRSGTSALARVTSLLGADLPATLLGGSDANLASNAKGHWESEPLVRLNDEILSSAGINWRSPEVVPDQWYRTGRFEQFLERALAIMESEYGSSPLFVLKDPRTCKLVPFWLSVLEQAQVEPAAVSMIRNPEEVADSLLKRNGLDRPLGMLMWLRYVLGSEHDSRTQKRVHLSYDALLADWQGSSQSIADTFGVVWPSSSRERNEQINNFLSETDRHHKNRIESRIGDNVSSWAAEAYEIFENWAAQGESAVDFARLDAIRKRLDEVVEPLLAPLLVSYEKSAAVQKLQVLRSKHTDELETMRTRFRAVDDQIDALAAAADVSLLTADASPPPDSPDFPGDKLKRLTAAISHRHEQEKQEFEEKNATQRADIETMRARFRALDDQINAIAAAVEGDLAAEDAPSAVTIELSSKKLDRLALAIARRHECEKQDWESREARTRELLDNERSLRLSAEEKLAQVRRVNATVARRHEHEKQDWESREARNRDLLDSERSLRLSAEEKLAQVRRVNATLLIVRGRFEAVTEELARLRSDYEGVRSKSEDYKRRFESAKKSLEKAQASLEERTRNFNDLARSHEKIQAALEDRNERITVLRRSLEKTQSALAAVREDRALRLEERNEKIKELERSVKRLEKKVKADRQAHRDAEVPASSSSKRGLLRSLIPGSERQRLRRNIELVRSSGLFDAEYYGDRYADLQGDPSELLEHYVRHGGGEGRAPSAAFDGGKYLQRYPDVAAAGLNPLVHFLECGQGEARTAIPVSSPTPVGSDAPMPPAVAEGKPAETVGVEEAEAAPGGIPGESAPPAPAEPQCDAETQDLSAPEMELGQPGVSAPQLTSFSALAHGASDWLRSSEMTEAETLSAGNVAVALENHRAGLHSSAALQWFDAIAFRGKADAVRDAQTAVRSTLYDDQVTIEDAWLPSDFRLRVRLSVRCGEPLIFRCCQQADDGSVSLCAEQPLAPHISNVLDIRLASRFTPVLLVLADRAGRLIDSTLIPFPTLLRHGIHHGELLDHSGTTGWSAHARYASDLLSALADPSRKYAVGNVSLILKNADGTQPVFSKSFIRWLFRQFGIAVTAQVEERSTNPALLVLAEHVQSAVTFESPGRTEGRTLVIDEGSIPSLNVMLASEEDLAGTREWRTIIVDELSRRPLRAVDYPTIDPGGQWLLQQSFEPALTPGPARSEGATPVSIRFHTGDIQDVRAAFPVADDVFALVPTLMTAENVRVSAIVTCGGSVDHLTRLLASLARQQSVSVVECLLIGNVPDATDAELLPLTDRPISIVRTGIEAEPRLSCLDQAVQQAAHDLLLFVDDRKAFHDPRTLNVLGALCARAEIATAGCHVIDEIKNKATAEYKARTSYVPVKNNRSCTFVNRPNVNGLSLPPVYPVLANSTECMMTRREHWPLPLSDPGTAAIGLLHPPIAIGLAALERGTVNVATSLVSVADTDAASAENIEAPWLATTRTRFISLEEY